MELKDRYSKPFYLNEYFCKPGEVKINLPADKFDKLVYQLLLWLHTNNNIQKIILEKTEQQFYNKPDQYVKVLAYLLKKANPEIKLIQVDCYEIEDPSKVSYDIIKKPPEPKYLVLNYNPHSILLVIHNDKTYLIDPQYFYIERNKLRSLNSSEFHVMLTEELIIPHFTDSRKSGIFLEKFYSPDLEFKNPDVNFTDFFVIRKDKDGKTSFFKAFLRTQLL